MVDFLDSGHFLTCYAFYCHGRSKSLTIQSRAIQSIYVASNAKYALEAKRVGSE